MDKEQKEILEIVKASMFYFLTRLREMREHDHADINYILDKRNNAFSDIIYEDAQAYAEYLIEKKKNEQRN